MSERQGRRKVFPLPKFLARRVSERKRGLLGQISILIIFCLMPMFTLFAFSVNIGMLVQAKIALQNATDLAAYAGAAVQARQLTQISHLNYYMRMIYKKFLYKYYVLGNISLRCFPGMTPHSSFCHDTESKNSFDWLNPLTNAATGAVTGTYPKVPTVCISLSATSNPCQLGKAVPVVHAPPCNPIEPACGQLQSAAGSMAALQEAACNKTSFLNMKAAGLWMFQTDYAGQSAIGLTQLEGLFTNDIGVITEEELTLQRALNLASAINSGPVTVTTQSAFSQAIGPIQDTPNAERTVLAYNTLLNGINRTGEGFVFDPDQVQMTEMLPPAQIGAAGPTGPMLDLRALQVNVGVATTMTGDDGNGNCGLFLAVFPAAGSGPGNGLNVGVYRSFQSSKVPVYYAIQTVAHARVLFNPFGQNGAADNITLTAYAAAMPFGSRIGPSYGDGTQSQVQGEFTSPGTPTNGDGSLAAVPSGGFFYPRLKMDNDFSTESTLVLAEIYRVLMNTTHGTGLLMDPNNAGNVNNKIVDVINHIAIIPDIWELGRYNIPVDAERYPSGSRMFFPYFAPPGGSPTLSSFYTMWAPFQLTVNPKAFENVMTGLIGNIIGVVDKASSASKIAVDSQSELQGQVSNGLQQLMGPSGLQANQGMNVFRMPDPLSEAYWIANNINISAIPGKVTFHSTATARVLGPSMATSFVTQNDSTYMNRGRDGYSVKLVSFQSFLSASALTNDGGAASATPFKIPGPNELSEVAH